jgi:hypothetical protein
MFPCRWTHPDSTVSYLPMTSIADEHAHYCSITNCPGILQMKLRERQHCEETNQGRSAVIGARLIAEQKQIDSKRVKRHCVLTMSFDSFAVDCCILQVFHALFGQCIAGPGGALPALKQGQHRTGPDWVGRGRSELVWAQAGRGAGTCASPKRLGTLECHAYLIYG